MVLTDVSFEQTSNEPNWTVVWIIELQGELTICVAFHLPWETNAADSGPNPAVAGAWDPEKLRKIIAL